MSAPQLPQLPPRPRSARIRMIVTVALMLGAIGYGLVYVGCPR